MDKKENSCFEISTQSSDLKLTEMLWPEEGFLVKTPRNIHEHSWTVL